MVNLAIRIVLISSMLAVAFAGLPGPQDKQTEKAPSASSGAPPGAELYNRHCAVCHGIDLKGTGPVPPPYRTPPDLTTLARRHGGKFPTGYVWKVLKSGVQLPAHGPAEMPVWGAYFEASDRLSKFQVNARINDLASYIKSLQQ